MQLVENAAIGALLGAPVSGATTIDHTMPRRLTEPELAVSPPAGTGTERSGVGEGRDDAAAAGADARGRDR